MPFATSSDALVAQAQDLLPILEVAKDVGNVPVLHMATARLLESPVASPLLSCSTCV